MAVPFLAAAGFWLAVAALAVLPAAAMAQPVARAEDGRLGITPEVMVWDETAQRHRVAVVPDPDAARRPVIDPEATGPAARLLRGWAADGGVAGLAGVLYDNRDRGHSRLAPGRFPQIVHLDYGAELAARQADVGLAGPLLFDAPVIGNSSTAITAGVQARSLPRLAMTATDGPARAAQTALAGHLYVYPAHRDVTDAHDRLPANWALAIHSRGSSYSDMPFVEAAALALAAMTPETRAAVEGAGLLVPTLQMLLRRSMADIVTDEAYLTGRAHPSAFDRDRLRPERMMALARSLTPRTLPPQVFLRVVDEDFLPEAGLLGRSERLYDTPGAVARLWREPDGRRRMVVQAAASPARVERFDWAVLRGDPEAVRIRPLDPRGRAAEIVIDWHDPAARPMPGQPPAARIEIGVFAWNGTLHGAPAFLTVALPAHQVRRYAPGPDGAPRVVEIDHDAAGRGAWLDPVLDYSAPWRDRFIHDAAGRPAGWERVMADGTVLSFDAEGRLPDGSRPVHRLDAEGVALPVVRMVGD